MNLKNKYPNLTKDFLVIMLTIILIPILTITYLLFFTVGLLANVFRAPMDIIKLANVQAKLSINGKNEKKNS